MSSPHIEFFNFEKWVWLSSVPWLSVFEAILIIFRVNQGKWKHIKV